MKGTKLHGAAKRAVGRCKTVRKVKDTPPGAADPTTVCRQVGSDGYSRYREVVFCTALSGCVTPNKSGTAESQCLRLFYAKQAFCAVA